MTDALHRCVSSDNRSSQDTTQAMTAAETQGTAALTLGQNQALNHHILDSSDDCIKVLDLEGRILFMSRAGQALLGIQDITPFLNTSWSEFWEGEDRQMATEAIARARAGEVYTFQGCLPALSGEPKWWDIKVSPIRNAQGQVERLLCISRDITERRRIEEKRKQAEERLRESEARYRAIVNQAITGVAYTDLEGRLTLVNQKYCDITGYSAVELSQLRMHEITHPDDLPGNVELFNRMLADGTPFEIEKRYIRKDGSIVWVNNHVSLIRDAEGNPQSTVAIVLDISNHKQAKAALRESESRFRMMVESASDFAIFTTDLKGYITSWNSGAQRLLGYEEAEILGQYGGIIFTPEDLAQQEDLKERQKALQSGRAENERWHVRKNGGQFWASGLMMMLRDDAGQIQGFVKILRDMTAQKQAEAVRWRLAEEREELLQREQAARTEAEQANRVKDEFLAVLSHELRAPLNPILGWSTLLQTKKLDEAKTAQALATIQRNAKLQSELIEDLLDVSRILRGKLSLNVAPVDLASTLRAAMETVRLAAEAKSIRIEASLAADVGLVSGDSTRLQQVIWNLLSNAVKFTPPEGQVHICLERLDSCAQLTVSDTGQGIAPDFLPYVFDYFRQADGATTRKFGGLGLGLAIVRHLVELHGGTVRAESPGEGQGATFIVRLPLLPAPSTANQDEQSPQPSLNLDGIKVLVVEDDTDTRELVAFLLQEQGAQVTAVASAQEALAVLVQFKPDVLLSDIGMPDMDGYMLIHQLRALLSQGGQIPEGSAAMPKAIALTAYAGDFDKQKALQAGFEAHVTKPVEPNELVAAILTLLKRQGAGNF